MTILKLNSATCMNFPLQNFDLYARYCPYTGRESFWAVMPYRGNKVL